MIEHLTILINTFPGATNQTRCFTHILNLVAKSVLCQFEAPKIKGIKELAAVSDDIDDDIQLDEVSDSGSNEGSIDGKDDVDDDVVDDDKDGLPDEWDKMSEKELLSLEENETNLTCFDKGISIQFINMINNDATFQTALRCIPGH